MTPMLVYYSICLQGAVLGILWAGAVLLFLVTTFNPEPTNWKHQVSALSLFLYMTCIGGWIVFDVYQELQGAAFAFALVAYIAICIFFVAIIISAVIEKKWEDMTSLCEIFFCVLFIVLLIPVNSGRVC
jgi:energy-converting hydrogenase Eha subunit E